MFYTVDSCVFPKTWLPYLPESALMGYYFFLRVLLFCPRLFSSKSCSPVTLYILQRWSHFLQRPQLPPAFGRYLSSSSLRLRHTLDSSSQLTVRLDRIEGAHPQLNSFRSSHLLLVSLCLWGLHLTFTARIWVSFLISPLYPTSKKWPNSVDSTFQHILDSLLFLYFYINL